MDCGSAGEIVAIAGRGCSDRWTSSRRDGGSSGHCCGYGIGSDPIVSEGLRSGGYAVCSASLL
jgi:hypothetical protein